MQTPSRIVTAVKRSRQGGGTGRKAPIEKGSPFKPERVRIQTTLESMWLESTVLTVPPFPIARVVRQT